MLATHALAALNFVAGALHLAFTAVLIQNSAAFRELLIMENSLVTAFFLYSGISLVRAAPAASGLLLLYQTGCWACLAIAVAWTWGGTSTLSLFKPWLPVSESLILFATGLLGTALATFLQLRSSAPDHSKMPAPK